jgi:hypothetical protein
MPYFNVQPPKFFLCTLLLVIEHQHGAISWLGPRSHLYTSSGVSEEIELSKGGVLDDVFEVELRVWRLKSMSEAIVCVECGTNCLGPALEAFQDLHLKFITFI